MRGVFVAAVALLALAGCKSTAERAAEADTFCQSLGAPVGSNAYVQCRLAQQARDDERRRAAWKALGDGLQQASDNLARNQAIANANRPVNCTSTGIGNTVNTTCY